MSHHVELQKRLTKNEENHQRQNDTDRDTNRNKARERCIGIQRQEFIKNGVGIKKHKMTEKCKNKQKQPHMWGKTRINMSCLGIWFHNLPNLPV